MLQPRHSSTRKNTTSAIRRRSTFYHDKLHFTQLQPATAVLLTCSGTFFWSRLRQLGNWRRTDADGCVGVWGVSGQRVSRLMNEWKILQGADFKARLQCVPLVSSQVLKPFWWPTIPRQKCTDSWLSILSSSDRWAPVACPVSVLKELRVWPSDLSGKVCDFNTHQLHLLTSTRSARWVPSINKADDSWRVDSKRTCILNVDLLV